MTMHSEDWMRLLAPLVTELVKELFGAIFGSKPKKMALFHSVFGQPYDPKDRGVR